MPGLPLSAHHDRARFFKERAAEIAWAEAMTASIERGTVAYFADRKTQVSVLQPRLSDEDASPAPRVIVCYGPPSEEPHRFGPVLCRAWLPIWASHARYQANEEFRRAILALCGPASTNSWDYRTHTLFNTAEFGRLAAEFWPSMQYHIKHWQTARPGSGGVAHLMVGPEVWGVRAARRKIAEIVAQAHNELQTPDLKMILLVTIEIDGMNRLFPPPVPSFADAVVAPAFEPMQALDIEHWVELVHGLAVTNRWGSTEGILRAANALIERDSKVSMRDFAAAVRPSLTGILQTGQVQ